MHIVDGEALKNSVNIAISWLQYGQVLFTLFIHIFYMDQKVHLSIYICPINDASQRQDVEQDRINYTYSSYIPTLLRTIFSRRHDISYDDALLLADVVKQTLPMLAAKIGNDEVRFDDRFSFYKLI